jgi:hypothetical protein
MVAFRVRSMGLRLQVVVAGELIVEQVVAGVERLLPEAAPVRLLSGLRRGRNHVSWVLDSALGRLVGKVGQGGSRQVLIGRLAEHRRVQEHGVPVPPLLAFTPSSAPVGYRPLIVLAYLGRRSCARLMVMRRAGGGLGWWRAWRRGGAGGGVAGGR